MTEEKAGRRTKQMCSSASFHI